MLSSFACFSADFFSKLTFSTKKFMNTIRVSNSLDPPQAQYFVGPDLRQNCLKRISRSPDKSPYWKIIFFISHPKPYVVGTHKNRLNETVLLSTRNTC